MNVKSWDRTKWDEFYRYGFKGRYLDVTSSAALTNLSARIDALVRMTDVNDPESVVSQLSAIRQHVGICTSGTFTSADRPAIFTNGTSAGHPKAINLYQPSCFDYMAIGTVIHLQLDSGTITFSGGWTVGSKSGTQDQPYSYFLLNTADGTDHALTDYELNNFGTGQFT
jgi:hypothetical protein